MAILTVTALLAAVPVGAVTVGTTEGCTPGFWKNHTSVWQEYGPSTLVEDVYSAAGATAYGDLTLLEALQLGGGSGLSGAQKILLRAATAALLNAAYDPLAYPWQRDGSTFRPPLVSTVNAALASDDRATMLALASRLDNDNNLGCPL